MRSHIDKDTLVITTNDQGPGINPETRRQVFEPFYTTKPVGQGTGLGLSLAYSIITNHDGKMIIGDTTKGTSMLVSLPLAEQQTRSESKLG